jgi:serine/threonine-protein phosphatase 2A activator
MYNAEVLSKFPVVQHFPFGGMFKWERDPTAPLPAALPHSSPQTEEAANVKTASVLPQGGTRAPWAKSQGTGVPIQTSMPGTTISGTAPPLGESNLSRARGSVASALRPGPTVPPWSRQSQESSMGEELVSSQSTPKAQGQGNESLERVTIVAESDGGIPKR